MIENTLVVLKLYVYTYIGIEALFDLYGIYIKKIGRVNQVSRNVVKY